MRPQRVTIVKADCGILAVKPFANGPNPRIAREPANDLLKVRLVRLEGIGRAKVLVCLRKSRDVTSGICPGIYQNFAIWQGGYNIVAEVRARLVNVPEPNPPIRLALRQRMKDAPRLIIGEPGAQILDPRHRLPGKAETHLKRGARQDVVVIEPPIKVSEYRECTVVGKYNNHIVR